MSLSTSATIGRDGPAVLALHGGMGWDSAALRPWLDPLAEHARLTYVDLLGCGASPDPDDWAAVTHATWADGVEDVRARLDAEAGGHGRAVLFGHSYGAVIALEAALRHPDRVAGLVLCAAPTAAAHLGAGVARLQAHAATLRPEAQEAVGRLFAGPESDEAFQDLMADAIDVYAHDPGAHDLRALASRVRFRAAPAQRSFFELFADYDVRSDLPRIDVPVLVLAGRHDWLAPPAEAPAEMLAALPDAEGHAFEASGHLPFVEENEAFVAVVADWLGRRAADLGAADLGPSA